MSQLSRRAGLWTALLFAAACAERPSPLEPRSGEGTPTPPLQAAQGASRERAIHERLARRFALALRDADFRGAVYRSLQTSTWRESKVHLQRFLSNEQGRHRHRLAELAAEAEAAVAADLDEAAPIEVYLPVPEHRRAWRGDLNVLVATAEADRETPVAFDTRGKRQLLDPYRPPSLPVIALGRAETSFAEIGAAAVPCTSAGNGAPAAAGCGGGNPGDPPGPAVTTPGLYMTYARFNSTFEGWLKGAPEFEVHILGQDGSSNTMRTYQCAGESAGAPYEFNQDDEVWNGSVLLFSQTQLDAYKAAHPGQAIRVFVVEDDDGPCVIKADSAQVSKLFQKIIAAYGALNGGIDTLISIKTYRRAASLFELLKAAWSFFASKDELVGNAIEDVVAAEYFPGANWIVKGENTVTNGALRLEMR